ncbi:hypothetical protein [Microcoleus sp. D2_18a_D3]|uniref:hypothetical protein n=1 Tax=Microcoleus sp. D2_18a_D3 TaxID=3055330 RepID=UPI002FD588A9
MTMATTERPVRPAEMGRKEAEEVTQLIKDNFDSLGAMLVQARDRKAYKALGYRSFESYCQTEFGKSISSAYQLIEDAKVLSQLEARISEHYGEEVTLKFPASHLKPLKVIESIDDKLKAIEYAQKLAAADNRKATKKDLEIAVFQIAGKRSEDFKSAIQSLGFTKGVQVEVKQTLKNDNRGFVTNVDKLGKIHVEFYYGNHKSIPFDATELRILEASEKPASPASDDTLNKGDRVKIFAKGLEGKTGEVYIWKPGKLVSVVVEDATLPIDIAYAELEAIPKDKKNSNWEADLSWDTAKQTYYYFQKEDKIYSRQWPVGLTLTPHSHELNPIEFMANWEEKSAGTLLETLATPANLKTLVLAKAIELPEEKGKEFVGDLIDSLVQLFPQAVAEFSSISTQLIDENQQLREQLTEAETAIQSMIAASTPSVLDSALAFIESSDFLAGNTPEIASPGDTAAHTDFLVENIAETSTPGESAAHPDFLVENTAETSTPGVFADDWKSILIANNFSRDYHFTDDCTEEYRGWIIYLDPNGGFNYIDLKHPEKGAFCCDKHWVSENTKLESEDEIIQWTKGVINQIEDFCPGQLSLNLQSDPIISEISETDKEIIAAKRERILQTINEEHGKLLTTKDEKKSKKIKNSLKNLSEQLEDLKKFEAFKSGDTVTKTKFPDKRGTLLRMELTQTGMPFAWVTWLNEYGEFQLEEQHPLGVLTNLSNQEN